MLWKNDIYKGKKLYVRKAVMSIIKNKNELSVELTDIELDISKMINIKEAKVVYINGAGKFTEVSENNKDEDSYLRHIRLNDIPLVQINSPYYQTCSSVLASGYGIENADCEELKKYRRKLILTLFHLRNP